MFLLTLKQAIPKMWGVTVIVCLAVMNLWQMLPEKWAVCLHFCYRVPLVAMVDSMFLSIIWPGAACLHSLLNFIEQFGWNRTRLDSFCLLAHWSGFTAVGRLGRIIAGEVSPSVCRGLFQTSRLFVFWSAVIAKPPHLPPIKSSSAGWSGK